MAGPRKSRRTRLDRATALALVFASILLFAQVSVPTYATSYYDLQKALKQAQADQQRIEDQLEAIAAQKKQLEQQGRALTGDLAWLNDRSAEERAKYETLLGELDAAVQELNRAIQEFEDSQQDLEDKQAQYKERLRIMFESRIRDPLEILLDSPDAAGFFANLEVIAAVSENDTHILDELLTAKDDAVLKMQTCQDYQKKMTQVVTDKQAEIDALKNRIAQTAEQLAETRDHLDQVAASENKLLEESKKLESSIKDLQEKIAYYGGIMVWPYAEQTTVATQLVASPFGMRWHPILHVYKMHTGVDIGGRYGAPVVAAAKGKVIAIGLIAGYNAVTGNNTGGSGYGNYVVLDHGGSISTTYAHAKLIKVKLGQVVVAGQLIALCGSTGTSTGPHLHFEVRENGTPVNPMQQKYLGVR